MDRSSLLSKVRALPNKPGVYRMRDRLGTVLYIGKAKDLKKRVSSYFQSSKKFSFDRPKIEAMMSLVVDVDVTVVRNETEALLLESKLIKEFRPHYNTALRDDKRFLMIRVDFRKKLPEFSLTRNRTDPKSRYFGPFVQSASVKKTLQEMRTQFGILLGDSNPKEIADGTFLLYDDARAEIYGQSEPVTIEIYHQRVQKACRFLDGQSKGWLVDLECKMQEYSEKMEFEKAAEARDLILAIKDSLAKNRSFLREPIQSQKLPNQDMSYLKEVLGMDHLPKQIECFDISHISGTFVVASMVQFIDGQPARQNYRRFKIKSFEGNDDFRSMEEVVERRYRRLYNENRRMPDLIVIDGGAGQVGAALKAFYTIEVRPPMLIGLAKKEETIIFADGRAPLNLSLRDSGLKLLQRIRDEAHRFANSYNAELRSKKLKESILDEIPGLGPVKREAVLSHFKSIEKLQRASISELEKVPGVKEKLANLIYDYLHIP